MEKRIYTYWVNPAAASEAPAYIELCMQTWRNNIAGLELIVINHDNIKQLLGDIIDYELFFSMGLMMQKDLVSILTLAKYGGVFMDADTIVTKDIFLEIEKLEKDCITYFGYPKTLDPHVAIMICPTPENAFIKAAEVIALERFGRINAAQINDLRWDYFSNGLVNTVKQIKTAGESMRVLCRTQTGNILESNFYEATDTMKQYQKFYFARHNISVEEAVRKIKFGAVSLHNSWTPAFYMKYSKQQVLEYTTMMSALIRHALSDR